MATHVDPSGKAPDASSAAPDEYVTGQVLDRRYRLGQRIGRGGFGDVWRAEELLPDGAPFREVALKLLITTFGDAANWAEEAKLLASFRHPSLVTIYAAGILETQPQRAAARFVAMELLEGQNLAEVIRARGRIPWRRVLRWACSTAAALDVIHLRGVVHLDLKPANLFLGNDGALKVLDFGIARRAGGPRAQGAPRRDAAANVALTSRQAELGTAMFLAEQGASAATHGMFDATQPMHVSVADEDSLVTLARLERVDSFDRARGTATFSGSAAHEQVVIGTPGFMAPEVLELAEPTAAADAYALAVCVVQLITGHFPHAADDEPSSWEDPTSVSAWLDDIRRATLRGELRDLAAGDAPMPRGLVALCKKLLSVDPLLRGVTPGKLAEMFDEAWQRPYGTPDPPYLGLSPFPASAEGLLFGRDDDITRLGRELEFEPSVVLQGARGGGKTSLANAGLVPYLALRGVDGKDDWTAVRVEPGDDPDAALARAIAALDPTLERATPSELAQACAANYKGLALIVDPLEEALAAPAEKRARLEALIAAIAEGALGPVVNASASASAAEGDSREAADRPASSRIAPGLRLIVVLGEEHTAALLESASLGPCLRASLRFVGAPSVAAVAEIVGGPARCAGLPVAGLDAVVAEVQRELKGGPSRLPFVSLALRAWWEAAAASAPPRSASVPSRASLPPPRSLSGDRFRELGGVRGVIARHADRVIDALPMDERVVADELLLRLSSTSGAPVRWVEADLVATVRASALASRLLDVLAREHLVRRHGGAVRIGHEALLTGWAHLTSARLRQMDRLLFLERARDAAHAWERADNHADLLLHGALLDEARTRKEWAEGLLPAERAFVDASLKRARWRRVKQVGLGLLSLVVVLGGVLAKETVDAAQQAETNAKNAAIELEKIAELAAKSRRTEDPYRRVAYIAAAMDRGSTDAMLPVDLSGAADAAARADFLSLDRVTGASFPWDDRWAVGLRAGAVLLLVDFHPTEPDVIEGVDLDVDPEVAKATYFKKPKVIQIRPHADSIVEQMAFSFDTSLVTRSEAGEVKVIRLRPDGTQVVAATAPFRCAGAIRLAEAAPVLACATDEGLVRWDLRKARVDPAAKESLARHRFSGNVAALSADGRRVAATSADQVLLWAPEEQREALYTAKGPVVLARWSPRDEVLAVVEAEGFQIVDFSGVPAMPPGGAPTSIAAPMRSQSLTTPPSSARWDGGGVDFGICEPNGAHEWFYLRRGARAKEDAPPLGTPCAPPPASHEAVAPPTQLSTPSDYEELVGKDLGPYSPIGGWKLKGHRFLTRELVLFNAGDSAASQLLHFQGRDDAGEPDAHTSKDSVVAVERGDGDVAVQIGGEVRIYAKPCLPEAPCPTPTGKRLLSRPGHLLRRCDDGRFIAWTRDKGALQVLDASSGAVLGLGPRDPLIVVGADSRCTALYTQRLDGTLLVSPIAKDGADPRPIAVADGYVFDARPSLAREPQGPGLWLSLSSGAIARIDERSSQVQMLGYASPRAFAVADGPRPGDVAYVDATGVIVQSASGRVERVLDASANLPWEDLSVSPDGTSMLLVSADRIATLALGRNEITGFLPVEGKGRFSRWDKDGSVIAWSFDRVGGPEGLVIPRGVPLAQKIAAAVSNLSVDKGKLMIRR